MIFSSLHDSERSGYRKCPSSGPAQAVRLARRRTAILAGNLRRSANMSPTKGANIVVHAVKTFERRRLRKIAIVDLAQQIAVQAGHHAIEAIA